MKINLIPLSNHGLAAIEIDSSEFLIGRLEEPFVSAPSEINSYLSRQHAKILREENHFNIVDLGSQNGTKVNGNTLSKEPVILYNNDEIELAEELKFKVEIITPELDATLLIQKLNNELTLEPIDRHSGLNILVITAFPFIISKEAGVFASFQADHEAEMKQISRRHAFISIDQQDFILADMKSTNGTFVNNERISDQGRILQTGDTISFGGDFFSYIVKLNQSDLQQQEEATRLTTVTEHNQADSSKQQNTDSGKLPDKAHEPRTTFVNDPSPFLDILCDDDLDKNEVSNTVKPDNSGKAQEISNTKKSIKKWLIIGLATLLPLVMAGTFFFYSTNQFTDLEELVKQGDFTLAADKSIQMLAQSPNDSTLLTLSTKAILNSAVPQWQNDLNNKNFIQAENALKEMELKYKANSDIENPLLLMQWITDLYQFMSLRSENAKIVIFQNDHQLSSLLDKWKQNDKQNKLTLALIERNVPAFKPVYTETLSSIRTLEHDQDIYIPAINTLKSSILNKLQTNKIDALMPEVTQFENKYRAISGIENLKFDIDQYIELYDALKSENIALINQLQQRVNFRTPLFKEFAEQAEKEKLPSQAFSTQYHDAIQFWQIGDTDNAISHLLALKDDSWGSAAIKKLKHYQLIAEKYNHLINSKGDSQYIENLFNFHALLQMPEDIYFLNSIEDDFQKNKDQAVKMIQERIDTALLTWKKYLKNGGISGLLRLENQVSKRYQNQAKLLAKTYHDIISAKHLYTELKILDNDQWNQTAATVLEEMDKQKKWLNDLNLILKPSVMEQKLDLLSAPEELSQ